MQCFHRPGCVTRLIPTTSNHPCVATPSLFCHGGLGIRVTKCCTFRKHDCIARDFDRRAHVLYKQGRAILSEHVASCVIILKKYLLLHHWWNMFTGIVVLGRYTYQFSRHPLRVGCEFLDRGQQSDRIYRMNSPMPHMQHFYSSNSKELTSTRGRGGEEFVITPDFRQEYLLEPLCRIYAVHVSSKWALHSMYNCTKTASYRMFF